MIKRSTHSSRRHPPSLSFTGEVAEVPNVSGFSSATRVARGGAGCDPRKSERAEASPTVGCRLWRLEHALWLVSFGRIFHPLVFILTLILPAHPLGDISPLLSHSLVLPLMAAASANVPSSFSQSLLESYPPLPVL